MTRQHDLMSSDQGTDFWISAGFRKRQTPIEALVISHIHIPETMSTSQRHLWHVRPVLLFCVVTWGSLLLNFEFLRRSQGTWRRFSAWQDYRRVEHRYCAVAAFLHRNSLSDCFGFLAPDSLPNKFWVQTFMYSGERFIRFGYYNFAIYAPDRNAQLPLMRL